MMDLFRWFKPLLKVEKVSIDNNVFRLHYKFTMIMLIIFAIILSSKQYFGDPIKCDVGIDRSKDVIETYCWIYGTYIVKRSLTDRLLPGLGIDTSYDPPRNVIDHRRTAANPDDQLLFQKYYQWVCVVFCIQALMFYLPRYLWRLWENGRLNLLIKDLNGPLVRRDWDRKTKNDLVQYMWTGKYSHNLYAIRYTICEVLNLFNVLGQIYGMNWFLDGHFSMYGLAAATFADINPMNAVFPKIAKCKYFRYGPSGGIENHDALCVLPLNIVNEKLFLILWFWLVFLGAVTALSLVYRALVMCVPKVRMCLLMSQLRSVKYKQAKMVVSGLSFGDFFILYQIGKHVNPIIYKELVMGTHKLVVNKRSSYAGYPENIVNEI